MRKPLLALIVIALNCLCCLAQDATDFKSQLKRNLLSFNFQYESEGKVPLKGNGTVKAQDNCYVVYSGSMEVWCNGETKWTADNKSKEVYIETAEDIFEFLPQLSDIRNEGGCISAIHTDTAKGTVTRLAVTNLKASQKIASEDFTYKISSDKDWIITDLRD